MYTTKAHGNMRENHKSIGSSTLVQRLDGIIITS